jgi:hypothetical protein
MTYKPQSLAFAQAKKIAIILFFNGKFKTARYENDVVRSLIKLKQHQ